MTLAIESNAALITSLMFFAAFSYFMHRVSRAEGFGDFSVGISLLDTYAFILAIVPLTAGVSYFMMSLGFGFAEFNGITISWLRYFEWAISTPVLILGVVLLSQDRELTINMMALDVVMILTGFLGVVTSGALKLGFTVVSMVTFFAMLYLLMRTATRKVEKRPEPVVHLFKGLRNIVVGLWLIYPFVWIASVEGMGLLNTGQSFLVFMTLDLVSKGAYALVALNRIEGSDSI